MPYRVLTQFVTNIALPFSAFGKLLCPYCPLRSLRNRFVPRLPSHKANTSLVSVMEVYDTRLHRDAHGANSSFTQQPLSPAAFNVLRAVACLIAALRSIAPQAYAYSFPAQKLDRNANAIDLHCAP